MTAATDQSPRKVYEQLIARYRNNPLLFVREVIGATIISKDQESLLRAVGDACTGKGKPYISVVSGTGTGKTATLAWLVLWALCTHARAKIPCTATTFTQVQTLLWPEVLRWHSQMSPAFRGFIEIGATQIMQKGNGECFAFIKAAQANNPASFQGVHSEFVLFIFDEASGIPQSIYDAAEGSCSHAGSTGVSGQALFVCAGNGNLASGPFYDSHNAKRAGWKCLSFSSRNSPFCGADYIARQEKMYGKSSNQVRIRVNGQFPKDDPDTVILHDWAEGAKLRDVSEPDSIVRVAGLDPKGSGGDSIGFCIRQGRVAYRFEEWPTEWQEAQIIGRVMQLWRERAFDEINIDCIGVGSGVCSVLEQQGVPLRRVNVGQAPVFKPDQFVKLRDDLWWEGRDWFRAGDCRIHAGLLPGQLPDEAHVEFLDKAVHELTTPKSRPHSSGRTRIESKEELKRAERIGHSPGLADAFVLTFATAIPLIKRQRVYQSASRAAADYSWDA